MYLRLAQVVSLQLLSDPNSLYLLLSSCPRIGIDDLERYKIPVVNLTELDKR